MSNELSVERRTLVNSSTPTSVYSVRTAGGETRTFKVPEVRQVTAPAVVEMETREDAPDAMIFRGHALVFDSPSEDLGGFTEYVARGATKRVLENHPDTRALFNHDPNYVLGRTISKTLDLREDPKGLHVYFTAPDTSYARDIRELVKRGDVNQMSFAFQVERDRWEESADGSIVRTILELKDLHDVSIVTYPAYPVTDVTSVRDAEVEDLPEVEATEADESGEPVTDLAPAVEENTEAREALHRERVAGAKRRLALARAITTKES